MEFINLNNSNPSFVETQVRSNFSSNPGDRLSGFYESPYNGSSALNAPTASWTYLIECRHSNPQKISTSNQALQIAGSFFDQELYFRKTNDNPATAWSKLWHSNNSFEAWQTPTLNSNWQAAANFQPPRFRKNYSSNSVDLIGTIVNTVNMTAGTEYTLFTLPTTHRPTNERRLTASWWLGAGVTSIKVKPTGEVIWQPNANVSLNTSIIFLEFSMPLI